MGRGKVTFLVTFWRIVRLWRPASGRGRRAARGFSLRRLSVCPWYRARRGGRCRRIVVGRQPCAGLGSWTGVCNILCTELAAPRLPLAAVACVTPRWEALGGCQEGVSESASRHRAISRFLVETGHAEVLWPPRQASGSAGNKRCRVDVVAAPRPGQAGDVLREYLMECHAVPREEAKLTAQLERGSKKSVLSAPRGPIHHSAVLAGLRPFPGGTHNDESPGDSHPRC